MSSRRATPSSSATPAPGRPSTPPSRSTSTDTTFTVSTSTPAHRMRSRSTSPRRSAGVGSRSGSPGRVRSSTRRYPPSSTSITTRNATAIASALPFRLAPGVALPDDAGALFDRLGDLHAIARVHERAMEAHRRSDVDLLSRDDAPLSTYSGRGRLHALSDAAIRARLGHYLAATTFDRYADVVAPVVAVSADGTLGWLACEVDARGTQRASDGAHAEPVAFGYSWVELVARHGGEWVRIGNASSATP